MGHIDAERHIRLVTLHGSARKDILKRTSHYQLRQLFRNRPDLPDFPFFSHNTVEALNVLSILYTFISAYVCMHACAVRTDPASSGGIHLGRGAASDPANVGRHEEIGYYK